MQRGYEKANKTLNQDGFFLFNYGCTLSEEGYCKQAIPILIRTSNFYNEHFVWGKLGDCYMESSYLEALKCYKKSKNMAPHRFMPMYKIFELYKLHSQHSKAAEMAYEILNKKIKIPSGKIDKIVSECKLYLK